MKYTTYILLLGIAQAAQDPYECEPKYPCKDNMECVKRTILEVKDQSDRYQNSLLNDPTLENGMTSHWCIPDEWVKPVMQQSGGWDDSNDTKAEFELIEKPNPEDNDNKAYAAGISCDPDNGRCPFEDLRCVGRRIIKVDPESSQYQKMVAVDPTFNQGETSFWCVTDEIFDIGLQWNNKMNRAWGVEMKMWPVEAKPLQANEMPQGSGPGGYVEDNMGHTVKWGDEGIEVGKAGYGKIVVSEDEISVKMGATALGLSLVSGLTAMQSIL